VTAAATTATVLFARRPAPQIVPLVAAASYLVAILITWGKWRPSCARRTSRRRVRPIRA